VVRNREKRKDFMYYRFSIDRFTMKDGVFTLSNF